MVDEVIAKLKRGDAQLLLVSKSFTLRSDIARYLRETGYSKIITAEDGEKAVALARTHKPPVTIMDTIMPNLFGYEAWKHINQFLPEAVVIAMYPSQQKDSPDKQRWTDVGADAVLYIPTIFYGPEHKPTYLYVPTFYGKSYIPRFTFGRDGNHKTNKNSWEPGKFLDDVIQEAFRVKRQKLL